jgi:copper resistance protein D
VIPLMIARAVQFASCMTLLAIPMFSRWIAPPRLLAGREVSLLENQFRRLMVNAVLLALFSAVAVFWIVASSLIAETGTQWPSLLTQTQFGRLFLIRLALLIAVGASVIYNSPGLALFSSACALCSLAWAGHAAASENSAIQIAVDVLHLLAAGVWPGTLLPLAFYLGIHRSETRRVVRRFSASSLVAVSVLSVSGYANACFRLGTLNSLLTTTYGHLLLLKICLFVVTIAIAACNLLYVAPRLEASALRLRRNVALEIALAGGILFVVGALGLLPP